MTVAIIVQARMGSTRLPGKVMQQMAGVTVLEHVLRRCAAIPGADVVVCAMPDEQASETLAGVARQAGAETFLGSERDVLARYAGAARSVGADTIIRVTSDCPLIDPAICGQVLELLADAGADYAANNMPPSFPHGLDCEAMTWPALQLAQEQASDAYDREHVTPWLRRTPQIRRANLTSRDPGRVDNRWTLDYLEDLSFFRAVFAALPAGGQAGMQQVFDLIDQRPDLSAINAMHHQNRSPAVPGASP